MTTKEESVNHPKHYNQHPSKIECIEIVEDLNFNIGNAVKYLWRAGLKKNTDSTEDVRKAKFYIDREMNRVEVYKGFYKDKIDLLNSFSAYKMKDTVSNTAKLMEKVIESDKDSLLAKFLHKVLLNEDPRSIFD